MSAPQSAATHPPHTTHTRGRGVLAVAAALGTAAAMTITLAPVSATAAAPKVESISLSATKAKVKTSKGKSVTVQLVAHRADSSALTITLATPAETHGWNLPISKKEFTLANDGRGKIAPALKRTSPYGQLDLTIAPAAAAKVTKCKGQPVTKTRKLTVSGTFWFNTRSGTKGWGAVGSQTRKFTFSTSANAVWNYEHTSDCGGGSSAAPCTATVSWGAFAEDTAFSGQGRQVVATRNVSLAKPVGASRSDLRILTAKSATLTEDTQAKTAKLVVVGNGKTLTGNGVFRGGNRTVTTVPCGKAGKRISTTMWYPVNFRNGKKPLRATDIYGPISVPNASTGILLRGKVKG